jgi:hypothetical protein
VEVLGMTGGEVGDSAGELGMTGKETGFGLAVGFRVKVNTDGREHGQESGKI